MKVRKFRYWILNITGTILIFFCVLHNLFAQSKSFVFPALIPQPQKIFKNNQYFQIDGNESRIVRKLVDKLPEVLLNYDEAYFLRADDDSLLLLALTPKGLFRGEQTINQLTFTKDGKRYVAGCHITDWPAFKIRGFMQDAGRNFMSLPMLKEQIDVMAAYKFNTFHFHLTDNPGWRLESKKYPQLASAGSMSRWPGKYYSQEDFIELVNYCNERFITLIPEFDIPGHSEAFRKAFNIDSMSDSRVQPILIDLIDELCSLVPKEKMPFIHLGTDEVWHSFERPAVGLLDAAVARVKQNGREVIVWRPGQQIDSDKTSITQLWSSNGKPKEGHRYIDSRLNYLNHLDPLAGVAQLYFDRICNAQAGDSFRLGGILCCWNDNNVNDEYDILRQNPVYPGMLTYSETSWKGQPVDFGEQFLAKLPSPENPLFQEFQEFENRLVEHRDRYFQGKPFPYVRQSDIQWSVLGPFDNNGNAMTSFPVENSMEKEYFSNGQSYKWAGPVNGGTIHIKHFFGFPSWFSVKTGTVYATTNIWSPKNQSVGCWIGFHDWSRSGGRRGGPLPNQGEWHFTNPKIWLNGEIIPPPRWKNPGLGAKSEEIPFEDENYYFREPSMIFLKKGWNTVLIKIPQNERSWKWMFTFVPIHIVNGQVKEVEDLKYSTNPQLGSGKFKLAPVFSENMVFQQNIPVAIYGTAGINDQIEAVFGGQNAKSITDTLGNWKLNFAPVKAGGPYILQIFANGKSVVDWKNILVGEVWFCSGQSNMQFPLDQSENGKKEAGLAFDNELRIMNYRGIAETLDTNWDSATLDKTNRFSFFEGIWQQVSQAEAAGFSAVAYYFGKQLREKLRVPVGLIQVTVGGAPAESFIDYQTLSSLPLLSNLLTDWFSNNLVMPWCRERALKNIGQENHLSQFHPYMPSYIYSSAISSFSGFPVKGVLFYQGESNVHNPEFYEYLFPELVNSWRRSWNISDLPFYFAQISSIDRTEWPNFRNVQRRLSQSVTHSGMVVTSDLGDSLNVHPIRKREVGERFARLVLNKVYGQNIECYGPEVREFNQQGEQISIQFNHANKLFTSDQAAVREFEVAGNDGIFKPVNAVIHNKEILIQTEIGEVQKIRYGWKPFSRGNLVNEAGLPASTFVIERNKKL